MLSARSEKIHITDNVNASDIAACDTAVDKTMAQYRHISMTDFSRINLITAMIMYSAGDIESSITPGKSVMQIRKDIS